jgi:hypothetical protein
MNQGGSPHDKNKSDSQSHHTQNLKFVDVQSVQSSKSMDS